jgi:hypothetical protein
MIHMNGRIYDPVIGRFLQADPIIQAPGNAQSHNRYSYVLNNPLSFTDPSGFSWWTKWRKPIIGLVAGIVTAGLASWAMGAYAAANGATLFASAAGAVNGFGLATAAAAGGFASGGIMGGNIQSALRGAFSAFVTAGVLQGIGELMSSAGAAAGTDAAVSSQSFEYVVNGNGVVSYPNGSPVNLAFGEKTLGGVADIDGQLFQNYTASEYSGGQLRSVIGATRIDSLPPPSGLTAGGMGAVLGDFYKMTVPGVSLGSCVASGCGGWGWIGGVLGSMPLIGALRPVSSAATAPALSRSSVLHRRGDSDSLKLLRDQAAQAEAKIGYHGVSVSLSPAGRAVDQVVRCATCAQFENAGFQLVKTGGDPNHYTAVFPSTISPEIAKIWNSMLTIRP